MAHEALIREWPRLRGWVDERRDELLLERQLDAATTAWIDSERDPGYLLREARLAQFEELADGSDFNLTVSERELLEVSRGDVDIAAARATRRRRTVTAVISAFAVLAGVLAVFAWGERNDAREEGLLARARELTALSTFTLNEDPELATLLALEANNVAAEAGLELPAVTSALYAATFNDRLLADFDGLAALQYFFVPHGVGAINSAGELGVRPHAPAARIRLPPSCRRCCRSQ